LNGIEKKEKSKGREEQYLWGRHHGYSNFRPFVVKDEVLNYMQHFFCSTFCVQEQTHLRNDNQSSQMTVMAECQNIHGLPFRALMFNPLFSGLTLWLISDKLTLHFLCGMSEALTLTINLEQSKEDTHIHNSYQMKCVDAKKNLIFSHLLCIKKGSNKKRHKK